MKIVAASFANQTHVQTQGVHLAGEKFQTLRADDRSLYVKKVRGFVSTMPRHHAHNALQGKEGAIIVKTKQSILIGHYPESTQPGVAATTVEKLGDYLISVGY